MSLRVFSLSMGCLLVGALVVAQETKKVELKCLVAGAPAAKMDKFAEYKGGKVYFCCDDCKGKFTKETAKFAVAANAQLVQSGQTKQAKCPISGAPVDAEKSVEVAGAKVLFCCENCQGKVAGEKDAAKQKELVFSDAAFAKAFEVKK